MWSSVNQQETQTRKITSKACQTSNYSGGDDPRWVGSIGVMGCYLAYYYYINLKQNTDRGIPSNKAAPMG
jgi:hypothetical protein